MLAFDEEKVFRLVICSALAGDAHGIDYHDGMIADLVQIDPWQANPEFEVPYIDLVFVRVKEDHGLIAAWAPEQPADRRRHHAEIRPRVHAGATPPDSEGREIDTGTVIFKRFIDAHPRSTDGPGQHAIARH
jgi:hypothetical protein